MSALIAEVVAIGDELTCGQRLDTNSRWLASRLGDLGIEPRFHTTVGDSMDDDIAVLRAATQRADVVTITGGLGPTADDLTRQAAAAAFDRELFFSPEALAHIERLFSRRGREMPERNRIQAQFPTGSWIVPNPHGTAPGFWLSIERAGRRDCQVIALPGVPAEMFGMWTDAVEPRLIAWLGDDLRLIRHRTLHCFGAGESEIERRLPDLIRRGREPLVGITASQATISLRISASGRNAQDCERAIAPVEATIRECLGDLVFGTDGERLEEVVVRALCDRGITVAVADAATRGLLLQWLAEADPAGAAFRGGRVVDPREARRHVGEAPADDARESIPAWLAGWARRIRGEHDAEIGIATWSVEETESTPGRLHVAIAEREGTRGWILPFGGHPEIVIPRAAKSALDALRRDLTTSRSPSEGPTPA